MRIIRWRTVVFFLMLLCGANVLAEGSSYYIFGAPGAESCCSQSTFTLQFGGGGDHKIYQGLAFNWELGYLFPAENFSEGLGTLSLDGAYHFGANEKLDPFVLGGYSLFFREGSENLFNFGAGINRWSNEKFGIRIEFRDHVFTSGGFTDHFYGFRFGLVFH